MSKIRLIRCKTPHDIIVIRKRKDFDATVNDLVMSLNKCGHNHLIVCGDLYFRVDKGERK